MSGERIALATSAEGSTASLVRVTARLADADLGPHALVGGLAVMCRLAAVHRATQDIDAVTETTMPTAIEVITSSIGEHDPANASRVVIDGVKVDIIETERLGDEDLDGISATDRLFLVSHRWALTSASETTIVVGDVTASIRVATAPALVAMKSGALAGGRRREPHKRASDLYDVYRLVLEHDRNSGIADALVAAPSGLGSLVGEALRSAVMEVPERAARWLLGGGPEMAVITPADLREVIGPLADRLR